jgi:hypothetical protein
LRTSNLVGDAVIGAGVKMTRRARRPAVAADLHIPEERLAEDDQSLRVR